MVKAGLCPDRRDDNNHGTSRERGKTNKVTGEGHMGPDGAHEPCANCTHRPVLHQLAPLGPQPQFLPLVTARTNPPVGWTPKTSFNFAAPLDFRV